MNPGLGTYVAAVTWLIVLLSPLGKKAKLLFGLGFATGSLTIGFNVLTNPKIATDWLKVALQIEAKKNSGKA